MIRKAVLLAAGLTLASAPAQAISRYDSPSLSCGEAKALVAEEGSVIFRYPAASNPSLTRYDRYVRNRSYCAYGEVAAPHWIPTADRAQCPLLRCMQQLDDDDPFRRD